MRSIRLRHLKGMTLVELMLSLFVTSMIGAAAVAVVSAVGTTNSQTKEQAEVVQAGRAGLHRLQRQIRNARLVTACSSHEVVLWGADTSDPGYINADEVLVLQYDESDGTVACTQVKFPPSMRDNLREALNVRCALPNLASASAALRTIANAAYRDEQVVAADIEDLSFSVPTAAPVSAMVTVTATFGLGNKTLSMSTATALRAAAVSQVDYVDGQYILLAPADDSVDGDVPADGADDTD
jgi:Tfp pilus assembly protein PilW